MLLHFIVVIDLCLTCGCAFVHVFVCVCVSVQLSESREFSLWEYLLTTRPGIGWVKGTASVTGVVLQVVICLMVLCSSTFVRRSGHFEVSKAAPPSRKLVCT